MSSSIRVMLNHEDTEIKKFAFANFGVISYIDSMNRQQEMYHITEDGFLDLAMSFTGDKARKTRIRFIAAFIVAEIFGKRHANVLREYRANHDGQS